MSGVVERDGWYELLDDLSRLICAFESLRAWSLWRFSSRCSVVNMPRGGLDEIDRESLETMACSAKGSSNPDPSW
jgi:hypothetical protein